MIRSFLTLKKILGEFTSFFDLQINKEKSCTIFTKQVIDRHKLVDILGFQMRALPIKYLGTSLTSKLIKHVDCNPLIANLIGILT